MLDFATESVFRKQHFFCRIALSLIAFAVASMTIVAGAQEDDLPFDVFGDSIDNNKIYRYLESQAVVLVTNQPDDAVQALKAQLKDAPKTSEQKRDALQVERPTKRDEVYRHMVMSSVYLGELYNCGRCDKTHAGFSGGVVISEEGLVLTNYHVLEQSGNKNRVEGYMAMTFDGKCFGIEKILAANKEADVALVKLKADGHQFYAAPIAESRPDPMDTIRLVSNPSGEFFVMTEGEVSRYVNSRARRGRSGKTHWMEITADFGGGSSGSAIFNSRGEVVGLVSRIRPLMRGPKTMPSDEEDTTKKRSGFVEMVLRKCVPLKYIHECFKKSK